VLEPCVLRGTSTVLRGGSASNGVLLPNDACSTTSGGIIELISLARELASLGVSLPYSAKYEGLLLFIEELGGG
jgi:hypothetical protein